MTNAILDHPLSPFNLPLQIIDHEKALLQVHGTHSTHGWRQKVCLLGGMAGGCTWPREDPAYEVWGCNALWNLAADRKGRFRADRWFELHPWRVQSTFDIDQLKKCPIPVYMLDLHEDRHPLGPACTVPNGIRFPLTEMLLNGAHDYFTCTFAYQIASAIALGFEEILLVGVALIEAREALVERPCVEFWLGVAMAQKIVIKITDIRGLGRVPLIWSPYRYGYDYQKEKEWAERYCERAVARVHKGWKSK